MKYNSTKIILLVVVLGVWGYIGFLIYGYVNPSEEIPEAPISMIDIDSEQTTDESLQLNYSDPFLRESSSKRRTVVPSIKKSKPINIKSFEKIKWPSIDYMGYVKGSNTLIMLNYNGKTKIVTQGELIDSFRIFSFSPNKVVLDCNGQQKEYKN